MRGSLRVAMPVLLVLALMPPLAHAQAPAPSAQSFRRDGNGTVVSATQLTIRVDSPGAMQRLERELARTGARIRERSLDGQAVLVEAPESVEASAYATSVAASVPVKFAEPAGVVTASLVPTDPDFSQQWGPHAIDAPSAWDLTWGSADVMVAVVDSGVDLDHPDLVHRLLPGRDFVSNDDVPQDVYGHGTAVTGIVVAEQNNGLFGAGVAPGVRVLPVRVLGDNGIGGTFQVAQGIRWATDQGADVINLSLGSPDYDAEIALALQYALDRDVVIVAAAGNSYPDPVQFPAREPGVIAVGALHQNLAIAGFSSRGADLDFVAPGALIYTTQSDNTAGPLTGTSAASPMVAGAVALLLSRNPAATRAEIEAAILATTRDLGSAGRDDTFGDGLVQAGAAMRVLPVPTPSWMPVFRFFNVVNGTHFYTPSETERELVRQRWPHIFNYEGVAYEVSSANGSPLYRFFNTRNGTHFYTASAAERNDVRTQLSHIYTYEGETFNIALSGPSDTAVYRFFNRANGSHFFTASLIEREFVRSSLSHVYTFEGTAFYRSN